MCIRDSFNACTSAAVMAAALAFLGLGAVLVCATNDVARNVITHNFHADFITLSPFLVD